MVRRLVQQQQIGAGEQQAAQRHAGAPPDSVDTSASFGGQRSIHRDLDVAVEVPGVRGRDLVLELGLQRAHLLVVGVGIAPHGHDLVVTGQDVPDRADTVHHVADDVLVRVEAGLLGQEADREPGVSLASPV